MAQMQMELTMPVQIAQMQNDNALVREKMMSIRLTEVRNACWQLYDIKILDDLIPEETSQYDYIFPETLEDFKVLNDKMSDYMLQMITKHRRDKSDWKTVGAHLCFEGAQLSFGKIKSEGSHTLDLRKITPNGPQAQKITSITLSDHKVN